MLSGSGAVRTGGTSRPGRLNSRYARRFGTVKPDRSCQAREARRAVRRVVPAPVANVRAFSPFVRVIRRGPACGELVDPDPSGLLASASLPSSPPALVLRHPRRSCRSSRQTESCPRGPSPSGARSDRSLGCPIPDHSGSAQPVDKAVDRAPGADRRRPPKDWTRPVRVAGRGAGTDVDSGGDSFESQPRSNPELITVWRALARGPAAEPAGLAQRQQAPGPAREHRDHRRAVTSSRATGSRAGCGPGSRTRWPPRTGTRCAWR